jgi:hypothetical protein
MKRHVFVHSAERFVTVEHGRSTEAGYSNVETHLVRDLDGNELGTVTRLTATDWRYRPAGGLRYGPYRTQRDAIAALLADSHCPTPGPNRYDR